MIKRYLRKMVDGIIYLESFFHPQADEKMGKKKILILRKDGLGDCILFYPTLKYYRQFYKNCEITLIFPIIFRTLSPLLEDMDKVIWFDHKLFGSSFSYRRRFLLDLKRVGYDVAIYPVFSREPICDFMIEITGAKEKVSFSNDDNTAYSEVIEIPREMTLELERDIYFAEIVTKKKIEIGFPTINIQKLPKEIALHLISQNHLDSKPFVIIFPETGNYKYRIWPLENFASIIEFLIDRGLLPVICGSNREKHVADDILNHVSLSQRHKVLNLVGKTENGRTDFADLAHIINHALFYFGSDTGPLHLSAALEVPTIGIIGSGGLKRFFPYGDPHKNRALYDKKNTYTLGSWAGVSPTTKETHPSIKNISLDSAKKEIDDLLLYFKSNPKLRS